MIRKGTLVVVLSLVGTTTSLSARAQTASEADRAEKLFAEASRLFEAGRYADACPKFEESLHLDPGLGTQFNLALCLEKAGKLGSAWRSFRAAERLAHATKKTGREEAARKKMDELRSRVSWLAISARDSDATLKVDGEQVDRETWNFYPIDPGEHALVATAPAKQSWQTRLTVTTGTGKELRVEVPALAAAVGEQVVVTVTKETSNKKRTVGFVIGGVGVAALGAAIATGVLILDDKSTADERCKPTCTDQEARDAVSRGKTLIPINYVAFGVAAVGLGVGTFLLLTSGEKTQTAAWITPLVGPDSGGASVGGRF